MERLIESRPTVQSVRSGLSTGQRLIAQSRAFVVTYLTELHEQMARLQSILTPVQLAKFYVWVDENEWCMQMLDSVWSAPEPAAAAEAKAK
jgi:hypothetical protein